MLYDGGAGIDTFEIRLPSSAFGTAYAPVLDLQAQTASMTWYVDEWNRPGYGNQHIETLRVQNFEWAVGSAAGDVIYALDSGSRILGASGGDRLVGRAGADQLSGGNGNDVLIGGEGVNRLEGGAGNDHITGGTRRDAIYGGSGNDSILDLGGDNLISAMWGDNNITVQSGNDEIYTGAGHDTVIAAGGNNIINTGGGNDDVTSGPGDDTVALGAGTDKAQTGAGDDHVSDVWGGGNIVISPPRASEGVLDPGVSYSYIVDGGDGYDVLNLDHSGGSIDHRGSAVEFGDFGEVDYSTFSVNFAVAGTREYWSQYWAYNVPGDASVGGYFQNIYRYQENHNFEEFILTNAQYAIDFASYSDWESDFSASVAALKLDQAVQTGAWDDSVNLGAGDDRFFVNLGTDTVNGEEGLDLLDLSRLPARHSYDISGLTRTGPAWCGCWMAAGPRSGARLSPGSKVLQAALPMKALRWARVSTLWRAAAAMTPCAARRAMTYSALA